MLGQVIQKVRRYRGFVEVRRGPDNTGLLRQTDCQVGQDEAYVARGQADALICFAAGEGKSRLELDVIRRLRHWAVQAALALVPGGKLHRSDPGTKEICVEGDDCLCSFQAVMRKDTNTVS